MRMTSRAWGPIANVGLLAASLLFVELILQLASIFFPKVDFITRPPRGHPYVRAVVDDDQMGRKGNPQWWDHDSRGFRNPSALSAASVVALGDSQTYGVNVRSEDAWPSVLSKRINEDVYNMGIAGYGTTQNYYNLPLAVALRPSIIIHALYFGNDFYDDYKYNAKKKRLGRYVDANVLSEIERLEESNSIGHEVRVLYRRGKETKPKPKESCAQYVLRWVTMHSKLYGLLNALRNVIIPPEDKSLLVRDFYKAKRNITGEQLKYASVFEGEEWQTILTSPYRHRVLDESDTRIRVGIEISKQAIRDMSEVASANGITFAVLLMPTKEYVFFPHVRNPSEHRKLTELVAFEDKIREEIQTYMHDHDIRFIDPARALRQSEQQPYFGDADGHPNPVGHAIIADEVHAFVKEHQGQ